MKKGLLVALAFGLALPFVQPPAVSAAADGATLLEERCSVCHPSDRPKSMKKTLEQWDATVTRMMSKGARLTEEEKATLVDYLSKTYKP